MPNTNNQHKYKFYAYIDSIRDKILCLEKEIDSQNIRLASALKLLADVEALEKKIITERKQKTKEQLDFLLSYCQDRVKAKKLLHEIKNGKFGK